MEVEVAVKMLQPRATEEDSVRFLREAAINGQFRHPYVVQLFGVVTVGKPVREGGGRKGGREGEREVYKGGKRGGEGGGEVEHVTRGVCGTPSLTQLMMVLELLTNGDLRSYLIQHRPP